MECPNSKCKALVPSNVKACVACGEELDFPNVRAAKKASEVESLNGRYLSVQALAKAEGREKDFMKIVAAAAKTQAVICMPLARFIPICADDKFLISTFSQQVRCESRVPHDGIADSVRNSVEEAFFPNYSQHIRFGAISFDGWGQLAYGGCSVELKEEAIISRATVFESPLFEFVRMHRVVLTDPIPIGYRAIWSDRAKIAAAKIYYKLDISSGSICAGLFIPPAIDTFSDCIEVHIYGPLNINSISRVSMKKEENKVDRILQRAVQIMLADNGIKVKRLRGHPQF